MKPVNLVKRAGKTDRFCIKAIVLNVPEVYLAVFDKFSTLDRLTLPVVETRGFSVLRGLPSGTDIVL